MATLYRARYLLPIASPAIEDGALLVQRGRIVAVDKAGELRLAYPKAGVVDFGDAVVLPPLVNAHTHLELTEFPAWAAALGETAQAGSFTEWILRVIRIKRRTDLKRFAPSMAAGIRQSLAAGTGAVGDICSYFPCRQEYDRSPMRGRLFLETLGRDPAQGRKVLKGIGSVLDEKRAGKMQLCLSPHAPYTLSQEYLEHVFDFARRRQVPTAIHLGESPAEVEFFQDSTGEIATVLYPFVGWQTMIPPAARRSPVAYLRDCGGLGPGTLLIHGVQVSASDVEALAGVGATVILCPRSNAALGVGLAPVDLYRQKGVTLGLGTDSLASCSSLSVWDEIAFAHQQFGGHLPPGELLQMATINGARALGLDGELGTLQPGWGGHFQVLRPPCLPHLADLETFLCAPGRTDEVASLYLDGWDVLQNL